MTKKLKELFERAETWPEEAQEMLIRAGREIEAADESDNTLLSADDVAALKRSAEDVRLGRFANDEQVRKVFDRHGA